MWKREMRKFFFSQDINKKKARVIVSVHMLMKIKMSMDAECHFNLICIMRWKKNGYEKKSQDSQTKISC